MSGPIQAFGSVFSGMAAEAAGKASNRNANRNADVTLQEGAATADRIRTEARATMGEAIAAQGTGGFQLGTGSALEQLRESKINEELDVMQVRRKAQVSADTQRYAGTLALLQGKWAMTAGIIQGAGDIAKSVESAGSGGAGA